MSKCATCDTPLLREDIVNAVENSDNVFRAAVNVFVQRKRTFVNCATPDCPQLLSTGLECVTCPICLYNQCPKCQDDAHKNESCEEFKKRKAFESSPEYRFVRTANHIRSTMLAPSCPKCKAAFIDFTGCFALTCNLCATGFCGYCLQYCGRDAHAHAYKCPWLQRNLPDVKTGYFNDLVVFRRCMRIRLAQKVKEYLKNTFPKIEDRREVLKHCLEDMRTSPFFDEEPFVKILRQNDSAMN